MVAYLGKQIDKAANMSDHPYLKYYFLILFIVCETLVGCGQPKPKKAPPKPARVWDETIPGNFSAQSKTVFDSTEIDSFLKNYPDFNPYANEIRRFYQGRNYACAWFEGGKLIEQGRNLASRMLNLQNEGISQTAPYQKQLDSLVNIDNTNGKPDIQTELMLTAQYFVFSRLAWQGLDNSASRTMHWYLPRKKVDYEQYLDSLLKLPANEVAAAEPVHGQYELLRAWLRKYRALDEHETWAPIVVRPAIIPGDTAAVVPLIRRRLYLLEDFKGDTLNPAYNEELQTAITHFQNRHGLAADGLLTKETLTELNVPLKRRIEQIIVNMERCRWLPLKLKTDYLAVNIPEFKLHVYHGDSLLWSCNVVVGKTMHQTTVFYGEIKYVVFRPYWDVPPSIVRKEILRDMRRHSNYLEAHQMRIIGYADGLPVIRQQPGPENSLGLVKFLFPNSYNIYLHDTPTKSLFGETARAFSHGCIRVQEPAKVAAFLLKDEAGWDAEKIEAAMQSGDDNSITLQNKVPVFIAYFTAFTGRDHQLNFRKDIYHLDGPLAAMILSGKRPRR